MRYLLFANGSIKDISYIKALIKQDDIIVALDGGLRYAHELKITPHYLIGDFDSVSKSLLDNYIQAGCEAVKYPQRKDFTDMEIGIKFALEKGAEEILIIGGLGGRFDHTLANIHAMAQSVKKGVKTWMCGESEDVFLIEDEIDLRYKKGTTVSLIPLSEEAAGVTTFNLDYSLKKESLYMGYARGVSNVFKGEWAKISLSSGLLAVIVNKDR